VRPDLQLMVLVLAAGDGRAPVLAPLVAPKPGVARVESAGRTELWTWERRRVRSVDVTVVDAGFVLEGRDTNGDLLIDEEALTTHPDGGPTVMVQTSFPLDGGLALRRLVSSGLGGNGRQIDEQLFRDGGWQTMRSFESSWRDERHLE
jgi:hypothetical protein